MNLSKLRISVLNLIFLIFLFFEFSLLGLTVNLKEPTYEDGVLKTEQGGVIEGPNLRIQAKNIIYIRKEDNETPVITLEAEGDLIVEFGEYLFVGERIEYDFQNSTGTLYWGRTGIDPWFIGGKEIHLCADGSFVVHKGFATTSENYQQEWEISTENSRLDKDKNLVAKNVQFRFVNIPLFWMPSFRVNLDSIFDSPIRYVIGVGGSQGPRIGMVYEVLSWERWKVFLHLDYRTARGLGGGMEFDYRAQDRNSRFRSINYIANDTTLYNHHPRTRYRYQGMYYNNLDSGRTNILLSYDKLSDKDMPTDYCGCGLNLETAERTQLDIRRENRDWICNLFTRVRLNSFQTIKQELPTLEFNMKTDVLGKTGILMENRIQGGYLEQEYNEQESGSHNYNSTRYEIVQKFYRPFRWRQMNITPEIGSATIYYGNSHKHDPRWMAIGLFELNVNTDLYKFYGNNQKHVITPYLNYQYYTHPTTPPKELYIFDIDDGWYYLNMIQLGVEHSFYRKLPDGCIWRYLHADFFTYAFIDTHTISAAIPQIYSKIVYFINPRMRYKVQAAWDCERNRPYHFNNSLEWTVNNNTAMSIEYRYRSPYDWRKADHTNFILNSYVSEKKLHDTALSDKRDTVLFHFYHRWHPNWATEFQSRHGWDRKFQPSFNEFEIDMLGTFRSAWNFTFSYRHREDEDRFTVNFSLGLVRPDSGCRPSTCLEF